MTVSQISIHVNVTRKCFSIKAMKGFVFAYIVILVSYFPLREKPRREKRPNRFVWSG